MGHFLSFGIATIVAIECMINRKTNFFIITIITLIFFWHGIVKYSIWQGLDKFEKKDYSSSISHLERAVTMYPKSIGRFHLILGQMYLERGELIKAKTHAVKANGINPEHKGPIELIEAINNSENIF